jgi:DNA-binding MarR family transcriptional regulator
MKKPDRKSAPRRDSVDLGWLQSSVTFHLRHAQDKSFRTMTRRARAKHWRPGVFSILVVVQQNPGINQTQLSRAIGRDKSSLTDTLLTLDEEGLVTRARTSPDRRSYGLSLTASGEALLGKLWPGAKSHEAGLRRVLGPKDSVHFVKLLQRIIRQLPM